MPFITEAGKKRNKQQSNKTTKLSGTWKVRKEKRQKGWVRWACVLQTAKWALDKGTEPPHTKRLSIPSYIETQVSFLLSSFIKLSWNNRFYSPRLHQISLTVSIRIPSKETEHHWQLRQAVQWLKMSAQLMLCRSPAHGISTFLTAYSYFSWSF